MTTPDALRMIDGDGHVIEDLDAIADFLPEAWKANTTTRTQGPFPRLDHVAQASRGVPRRREDAQAHPADRDDVPLAELAVDPERGQEIARGGCVVAADLLHETARQDGAVDRNRQQQPRQHRHQTQHRQRARQRSMQTGITLA